MAGSSQHTDADIEQYKAMVRQSDADLHSSLHRSDEFLGQSDSPPRSPYMNKEKVNQKHKWGKPVTPEQCRPDDWLGSPSKRRGYKIKEAPTIKPLDDDSNHPTDNETEPSKSSTHSKSPVRSSYTSPGRNMASRKTYNGSPNKGFSPSTAMRRKTTSEVLPPLPPMESASPLPTKERGNRTKFVAAFAAFESDKNVPKRASMEDRRTLSEADLSAPTKSPWGSVALRPASTHTPQQKTRDLTTLDNAIGKLRKVVVHEKKKEPAEEQASELMQMFRHLKNKKANNDTTGLSGEETSSFLGVVDGLRNAGMMDACLEPQHMDDLDGAEKSLQVVVGKSRQEEPYHIDLMAATGLLRQVTPKNPRAAGMIDDTLVRLRKVTPQLPQDSIPDSNKAVAILNEVGNSLSKKEEEELANVIRNVDPDDVAMIGAGSEGKLDKLTCVMGALEDFAGGLDSLSNGSPTSSQGSSQQAFPVPGETKVISPKTGAPRNFRVSKAARAKSLAVFQKPLDVSSHSQIERNEALGVLSRLRKVAVKPKKSYSDKCEKQANEIMQILQHLRHIGVDKNSSSLRDMMDHLMENGIIESHLGDDGMKNLQRAIERLQKIHGNLDDTEYYHGEMGTMINRLRRLTPSSDNVKGILEDAVSRLRKIVAQVPDEQKQDTEEVVDLLKSILSNLEEGEEEQLATAIRTIEDGSANASEGMDELIKVLSDLEKATEDKDSPRKKLTSARLSSDDADFLAHAIRQIKKLKLTKREAGALATVIRNLEKVESDDEEATSDEKIAEVGTKMDSQRKTNEIVKVLRGLRRLDMNDAERADLAEIVRTLGKGSTKYRDEIAESIGRLKKIQMNRQEAKEVAGVMFNLRKSAPRTEDDKEPRALTNIRRIMGPQKANVVADVFNTLRDCPLSEKEADEFAAVVAELGVAEPSPEETQLVTVEYTEGEPHMVVTIPNSVSSSEEIEELGLSDHVNKNRTRAQDVQTNSTDGSVEISLDLSENVSISEVDSEFERESDVESPPARAKDIVQTVEPVSASSAEAASESSGEGEKPVQKPKQKDLRHYANAQEQAEALDSMAGKEPEVRTRQSRKPRWRHKKHNKTVVNEKRWRFNEEWNADEVIWSPLSRDQYDRRRTVGNAILKTMDQFGSMDDMLLDEFEEDDDVKKDSKRSSVL